MRSFLFALVVFLDVLSMTPARPASYTVNGFTLGDSVRNRPTFKSYQCEDSSFDGIKECSRTVQQDTRLGAGTLSSKIMRAEDGTAIYLMTNLSPVSLDEAGIRKEIDGLSNEFKQPPKTVEWPTAPAATTRSAIAIWGDVQLRPVNPEDFDDGKFDPVWPGIFLDPLGDLEASVKAGLPIYRVTGGPGYIYCASFDRNGRGHRHYEAIDIARRLVKDFVPALQDILDKDQALAATDYGLWPDVARLTRHLALDTSPTIANQALDKGFEKYRSKKLRSHVWSLLPMGTINYLEGHEHSGKVSTYGPDTHYPGVRRDIQTFLKSNATDPFSDFLYYTVGEFDEALRTNPKSVISDVINYARGHELLQALLQDLPEPVRKKIDAEVERELTGYSRNYDAGPVNSTLIALNWSPELYDNKLLGDVIPNFAKSAAAMRPYFQAVLRDKTTAHSDDAAYMLGWLAYHQGQSKEALDYLSQAMVIGNGDYKRPAAMRQVVRILGQFPPREQVSIVEGNPEFSQQPAFWYAITRSAFRTFDYATAMQIGEQALNKLHLPIDRLPASTNAQKITDAVKKIIPPRRNKDDSDDEFDYTNAVEIPYIVEASREITRYQNYLKTAATDRPDNVQKKAKEIVVKYSLLLDQVKSPGVRPGSNVPAHKDLRQALHLIDTTLASVPANELFSKLREWLHYRKVRVLVQYDPAAVHAGVSAMEAEFPKGDLVDDALAEEIFAEGAERKNLNAAEQAFHKLITEFPKGNAVDNGYTWMAIIYRCMGRADEARKLNADIVRLFPASRHAVLALERQAHPEADACGLSSFKDEKQPD